MVKKDITITRVIKVSESTMLDVKRRAKMKKMTIVLALAATLMSNGAFAQANKNNMGAGAQAGTSCSYNKFAWGLGLGMLVVLGIVVGVTAAAGVDGPHTFSH